MYHAAKGKRAAKRERWPRIAPRDRDPRALISPPSSILLPLFTFFIISFSGGKSVFRTEKSQLEQQEWSCIGARLISLPAHFTFDKGLMFWLGWRLAGRHSSEFRFVTHLERTMQKLLYALLSLSQHSTSTRQARDHLRIKIQKSCFQHRCKGVVLAPSAPQRSRLKKRTGSGPPPVCCSIEKKREASFRIVRGSFRAFTVQSSFLRCCVALVSIYRCSSKKKAILLLQSSTNTQLG